MKLTVALKRKDPLTVEYKDLSVGEVFLYEGMAHIRIEDSDGPAAIELETGGLFVFDPWDAVELVYAELTLTPKYRRDSTAGVEVCDD